ncbi:MAG: ABC transporter permease [Gemmatimonadetes bacterium]|nr:ABC transporter permease [Gemmatimonadota bacterium]
MSLLRLAFRRIARARGYALAFVLTLGLGIGINSAIFSVVNGVLVEPLPYNDSERLVYLRQPARTAGFDDAGFSFIEIRDLRTASRTIDQFVEYGDLTFGVVGESEPHRAVGGLVSSNYFEVLGLRPRLGRTLHAEDDGTGVEPVMVLTDGYWQRVFGADSSVIGRTLKIWVFGQSKEARIVGVLEPGSLYTGTRRQEFFVNYAASEHYGSSAMLDERTHRMTSLFGRLASGQTVEIARAELSGVHTRMREQFPDGYPQQFGLELSVESWRHELTANARPMLLILAGTVALVLLLACANVANLTLTRMIQRERELSVQAALGAGVFRIRKELLAENMVLAFAGAALGLVLAALASDLLIGYAGRFTVRTGEIGIDFTVLAVTALVATAAAVLLAWIPPLPGLRGISGVPAAGSGQRIVGLSRKRLQHGLVIGQLALCFTLITGATLLVRSLINLSSVDAGLDYESVIAMDIANVTGAPAPDNRILMDQLVERTRGYAGVRQVAYASHVPFTDDSGIRLAFKVGNDDNEIASPSLFQNSISTDYFETVGIRLASGRPFQPTDVPGSDPVAIVNASLARYLFGGADPLEGRIRRQQLNGQFGPWIRIVGVAADTREYGIAQSATHTLYRPASQVFPGQSIVIRTAGDVSGVIQHVRSIVRELDAERPVDNVATLENLRLEDLAPPRLNATLFSLFAALALVIASVGVLGVLGFSVTQRTREFGVRMALGARTEQVRGMVLGEGSRMLLIALVVGAAGSLLLTRFLGSILFQVGAADPATYATVTVVLTAVALLAAYLPARRATRVHPAESLRVE